MKKYALKIDLPHEILSVMNTLEKHGFEAYAAGGAVRDFLLNVTVSDYDIATDAKPEDIHSLFEECFDTGIKHGTVTVVSGSFRVEITTYRIDGEYKNHRSPEKVVFSPNLEDDLARRDFTINALVYNPRDGICDCFSGVEDLKNGIVRAVGNAEKRFSEDALRILRAVRFACVFGFEIEENTFAAMQKNAPYLSEISCERIKNEFEKILCTENPETLIRAINGGIFESIFPYATDIKAEKFQQIMCATGTYCVKWALFIWFCGKENAERILSDYKFSNFEKRKIKFLIEVAEIDFSSNTVFLKRFLQNGEEYLEDACCFVRALGRKFPLAEIRKIIVSGEAYRVTMLKVSGTDILKIAKKPADVGKILNFLLEYTIENPCENTYEKLTERANEFYEN